MNNLHALARLFVGTVAANIVMLAIILRTYPEPFSLVMDPFSWLGKLVTSTGLPNAGGLLLFNFSLLFDICIWKKFLSLLSEYRIGRHPAVRILSRVVLTGFVFMTFPCDRFDNIHSLGAGLVVGGLWALTTSMLYRFRDKFGPGIYIALQLTLHAAAFFCGANFVFDTPLKGFSQRPLVIAILAETGICLNVLTPNLKARSLFSPGSETLHRF